MGPLPSDVPQMEAGTTSAVLVSLFGICNRKIPGLKLEAMPNTPFDWTDPEPTTGTINLAIPVKFDRMAFTSWTMTAQGWHA